VITFTVATHKEDLVLHITPTPGVQSINIMCELLPLCIRLIALIVSRISAVDQAEVEEGLSRDQKPSFESRWGGETNIVKSTWDSSVDVLKKEPPNSCVIDIG
jgi:hypothetical protein